MKKRKKEKGKSLSEEASWNESAEKNNGELRFSLVNVDRGLWVSEFLGAGVATQSH